MKLDLDAILGQAQRVPTLAWGAVGLAALVWWTRPRPSGPNTPLGAEDIQVVSTAGAYAPIGAHAVGLPYAYAHLCPVSWSGRSRTYPDASCGVVGMLAAPDPSDCDGDPRVMYGRGAG